MENQETLIDVFIKRVMQQDIRNHFTVPSTCAFYPEIAPLYSKWEPIDVEVVLTDLTAIHFYPSKDFKRVSNEYGFSDSQIVVFASWEGDPIFIKDGKVCLAMHGTGEYKIDKDFFSLNDFIQWIVQNMK